LLSLTQLFQSSAKGLATCLFKLIDRKAKIETSMSKVILLILFIFLLPVDGQSFLWAICHPHRLPLSSFTYVINLPHKKWDESRSFTCVSFKQSHCHMARYSMWIDEINHTSKCIMFRCKHPPIKRNNSCCNKIIQSWHDIMVHGFNHKCRDGMLNHLFMVRNTFQRFWCMTNTSIIGFPQQKWA
jgi:hypothetical protein